MAEIAIDPNREQKARELAKKVRLLFVLESLLGLTFLLILLLSGLSEALRDALDVPFLAKVVLFFIIFMSSYTLISLPLTVYGDFILPKRFGLLTQNWKSWTGDRIKEFALGFLLSTAFIVAIYYFLESFSQIWWLLAFAMVTTFTIILSGLAPIIILPLFFKLERVKDTELRNRLIALSQRCHAGIQDIFQINLSSKTVAGNAVVMGWGRTRRIALGDTLLEQYSPEEIEVVIAHELGHHRHRDIARAIIIQSLLMLFIFYIVHLIVTWAIPLLNLESISDVAAMPLLVLSSGIITFIFSLPLKAYTRHIEQAADRYALAVTQSPNAYVSMLTKLTDQNLVESHPSKLVEYLFYDHPPYYKRVALASSYIQKEAI